MSSATATATATLRRKGGRDCYGGGDVETLIRCTRHTLLLVPRLYGDIDMVIGCDDDDDGVVMCGDVVVVSRWLTFVVMSCGSCRW